jgi:hypothetical protein
VLLLLTAGGRAPRGGSPLLLTAGLPGWLNGRLAGRAAAATIEIIAFGHERREGSVLFNDQLLHNGWLFDAWPIFEVWPAGR